jgi:hypothetical protein
MRLPLELHPDFGCAAAASVDVEVERPDPVTLTLVYRVQGSPADLRLPPAGTPERTDGLWEHTCFEAFVRAGADAPYVEFNFAPSLQWAAYRFSGYRRGMRAAETRPPALRVHSGKGHFELHATLRLEGLADLPSTALWKLNLSAVIEEANGGKSYWALAHPAGKPDFHHPACFTHELQPPAA